MKGFGKKLIEWYQHNQRELPWRKSSDPYKIWLSEVIMQQTRVNQGHDYYLRFENRFPDIYTLAEASEDEVYKLWQGLGYYNRADNLMHAARTIVKEYGGRFPEEPEELMKIKGIGSYTASAVASIAFGKASPVVDGNVFRVLSRIFGVFTPIDTSKGKKEFSSLAGQLMTGHPPGIFNQALMEFGAIRCKPKNPGCTHCVFFAACYARKNNAVPALPVKKPKAKVKDRYFYYVVAEMQDGKILMKKRVANDIWKNLYDFPLTALNERLGAAQTVDLPVTRSIPGGLAYTVNNVSREYIHLLTHQRIHAVFIRVFVENFPEQSPEKDLLLIEKNKIEKYPVPRLVEQYLQDQKLI